MRKIRYIIFFAVLAAACRPAKKVQRIESAISKKDTSQTVVVQPLEEAVDSFSIVKSIIGNLNKQRIDFTTFSAKMKVDYEGKEDGTQSATAYVRISKDSVVWVSLTGALGIEGFRVLINKDSVKVMNKLQKTVQYRSIAYLQELTEVPFDFYALQDVFIGNPVFIDSNIVSYKANNDELLVLMVGNVFKHLITLENKEFRVIHSKLDDIDAMRNRTCDITYDGYENEGNFYFSTKRRVTVSEKSKLDIDVEFKSYNFNKPQDYPFSIPKNYKRR
ncbi:MAG TPA: DUF4292 domain-containing protein [Panacibacter sp.]|nr:DUF4292 domain-containing protein [Panacibacter sp.]